MKISIITMLGHIFYFIGLFIFFLTLTKTFNYFRFIDTKEWIVKFKKVTGKEPLKTDFRDIEDHKLFVSYGCLSIIEGIWFMTGLVTNNWIIFGSFVILSMLIKQISDKSSFNTQKVIGLIFNWFKATLIAILVLNHFHFHQDLITLLFRFI